MPLGGWGARKSARGIRAAHLEFEIIKDIWISFSSTRRYSIQNKTLLILKGKTVYEETCLLWNDPVPVFASLVQKTTLTLTAK